MLIQESIFMSIKMEDPFSVQQPMSPVEEVIRQDNMTGQLKPHQIMCPFCGSTQFFGRRRVSGLGWVLYISSIANFLVSVILMFFIVGFCTVFLTPVLSLCAYVWGFEHCNTCASCKKDF